MLHAIYTICILRFHPKSYLRIILCRYQNKIKHCRITLEGRMYYLGSNQFDSLNELVDYYKKFSLYKKMKLRYPLNQQVRQYAVYSKLCRFYDAASAQILCVSVVNSSIPIYKNFLRQYIEV